MQPFIIEKLKEQENIEQGREQIPLYIEKIYEEPRDNNEDTDEEDIDRGVWIVDI